jgi:hypothetical protein
MDLLFGFWAMMLGQDDYGWKVVNYYLFVFSFCFFSLFNSIEVVQEVDHVNKDVDHTHAHVHMVFILAFWKILF